MLRKGVALRVACRLLMERRMRSALAVALLFAAPVAASTGASFGVGATVIRSATVAARVRKGAATFAGRGAAPARIEVAPSAGSGDIVVTLLY